MYRRISPALVACMSLWMAVTAYGADFYVSPQGDDANPGTLDRPFQTLERARGAVRTLKANGGGKLPAGGVTVWLRGGRYELSQTFVVGPEDSGQQGSPVVYRSYGDEQPVISGGRVIGGWEKVEGVLPGLPEASNGKVWVASVPEAKEGKWPFRQLWANGKRLMRSRAGEGAKVVDASLPPAAAIKGDATALELWRQELQRSYRTVEFSAEWVKRLPGGCLPSDLDKGDTELVGATAGGWEQVRVPIEKATGAQVTTAVPMGCLSYYWGRMWLMGYTGCIENALSFLYQPGWPFWYLDRKAGLVYYCLPEGGKIDPKTDEFVAAKLEQLLCIRGTDQKPIRFVELRGLRLEHAEWTMPEFGYRPMQACYYGTQMTPLVADVPVAPGSVRPKDEYPEYCLQAAVDLMYAEDCLLELCRVGRVGASGIGLGEGCRRVRVVGCEVFDAGGNGIHVGVAHGPICFEDFAWKRGEDEPQANEISNCYVHHNGRMDYGAYGILNSYCRGTRIAHNLVEQQPYSGICACLTWFAFPSGRDEEVTVEYNHVHHVMQVLRDGGAIYTKDGVAKTSVIRGNLIHDVAGGGQNNGFFLDDRSYGFHIEDNIVYGTKFPVRFNGTTKEKFTWGTNYFNASDYPPELAAKAGLEEPYKSLLLGKP